MPGNGSFSCAGWRRDDDDLIFSGKHVQRWERNSKKFEVAFKQSGSGFGKEKFRKDFQESILFISAPSFLNRSSMAW